MTSSHGNNPCQPLYKIISVPDESEVHCFSEGHYSIDAFFPAVLYARKNCIRGDTYMPSDPETAVQLELGYFIYVSILSRAKTDVVTVSITMFKTSSNIISFPIVSPLE